jgi:hypothetical protein
MPSIRTNSAVFPGGKGGILTVLRVAYGEADVQPSLLPEHFSIPPPKSQGIFSNIFRDKL